MRAYQRAVQRFGHSKLFAKTMKHIAPPLDRAVSRLTGGKRTVGSGAIPTMILVNRGAKSGKEYRTPLLYITVGDGFGLVASNWGQDHHPGWAYNLDAHPDTEVVVDGQTIPVRARRATPEEKAELWPRFTEVWPAYDTYVERSGRDLRVFILDRR